jgi:hypothetical protein
MRVWGWRDSVGPFRLGETMAHGELVLPHICAYGLVANCGNLSESVMMLQFGGPVRGLSQRPREMSYQC